MMDVEARRSNCIRSVLTSVFGQGSASYRALSAFKVGVVFLTYQRPKENAKLIPTIPATSCLQFCSTSTLPGELSSLLFLGLEIGSIVLRFRTMWKTVD